MKRFLLAVTAALTVLAPIAATTASAQSPRVSCHRTCEGNPQCIRACNDAIQSRQGRSTIPPTFEIPEPEDKPVPKWIDNAFDGGLGGGGGGGGGGAR